MTAPVSPRVLKAHREAALAALRAGPYPTLEAAAEALATAVVEAEDVTRWVVLVDLGPGREPLAYGPYAGAETARKSIASGLMLPGKRGVMMLAMRPVPRRGHRLEGTEQVISTGGASEQP